MSDLIKTALSYLDRELSNLDPVVSEKSMPSGWHISKEKLKKLQVKEVNYD